MKMNETMKKHYSVLIFALAAFMHDIGKFSQRAAKDGLTDIEPSGEFKNKRDFYQPKMADGYSHIHALYTAYFIELLIRGDILKLAKLEIDKEFFIDLAARHHISGNTWEQSIISAADRLSAGMDRQTFEENAQSIEYRDWHKTRLMSIFEEIGWKDEEFKDKEYDSRRYQYSLSPLCADSFFPKDKEDFSGNYKELFKKFFSNLESLLNKDNLELWFENFDSCFKIYASSIPSASVEKVIPDISLYDHARTTAAFAAALYLFHKDDEKENKSAIFDDEPKKFIFLKSKFHGIQNFIFSQGGQTNKDAARILRGRSFYLSLIMELSSDLLCKNCGLPHTSIIMNAAGGITAILPNTAQTKAAIEKTQKQINDWLIEKFYGEVSISFAYIEAAGKDFTQRSEKNDKGETIKPKGLEKIGNEIAKQLEIKKFNKIKIDNLGIIKGKYFDENETICKFCGKSPAKKNDDDEEVRCPICKDLKYMGESLVKKSKLIIFDKDEGELEAPIFDKYNLRFSDNFSDIKNAVKCWDLDISSENLENIKTSFREFNAYVPKDDKDNVKTLDNIADSGKDGINALGILKADIDNLGQLFNKKIAKPYPSLSKQATFSRQLNSFFTIYLPNILKKIFPNVYTVFAGGDDLFLIGRWDDIIELAAYLREKFNEYSCGNVSFSAGISISKSGGNIMSFYRMSEEALENSKQYKDVLLQRDKNAFTLFEETISWNNLEEFKKQDEEIRYLIKDKKINSAGLFKLLSFIEMAKQEADSLKKQENISLKTMQNFKWRALLVYFLSRNDKIKGHIEKDLINDLTEKIQNANKRSILKTVLWKNIYQDRSKTSKKEEVK